MNWRIYYCLGLLLFCSILPQNGLGQLTNRLSHRIEIKKAKGSIVLDGRLNEDSWTKAQLARDFFQQAPYDTTFANTRTEVVLTYDEAFLYIGARCWDPEPGNYIVQSLKRDFSYPVTDAFAVYLDPFLDQQNGFSFAVSPLGVQREGLLENGGSFGVSTQWDNRWFSEVQQFEDHWEVEIAIPFKTLRYKENISKWGINFSRNNLKQNENSVWAPVPRNQNVASLAFAGTLVWDQAPPAAGTNISLIPYGMGTYSGDFESKESGIRPNAGLDAKIAITSALNLDLTFNPDFSQVEVDRQVTNLSRFSLFFPERRQFFVENSDLFGRFGFRRIRPFFSRQIGLKSGQAVPILAGARLSGKLSPKLRVGLLNMQTEGVSDLNLDPQNYTVAVVQQQVLKNSSLKAIFVNRQAFNGNRPANTDFNRLGGLEFNYASQNNTWRGKAFYQQSFDEQKKGSSHANAAWLRYQTRQWQVDYNHEYVTQNFNAEVGFVPRNQYFLLEPSVSRKFYPKRGQLVYHGPRYSAKWYWNNQDWNSIERLNRLSYRLVWKNRSQLDLRLEDQYVYLQSSFDPSGSGATPLPALQGYKWRTAQVEYKSDFRKPFSYEASVNFGGYYTGKKLTVSGELFYRVQPWGRFAVQVEQNNISLPDTSVALTLISPRFEFAFSRSVFFTTFLQFNTQTQNFNLNARLQWRFKPMSDLYVVLTDNYFTEQFGIRNRALVLKLNYWFTL